MEFLDKSGVTYLWKKMKQMVQECINDYNSSALLYKSTGLTFDGTNYEEVDFQPFSEEAPNFELVMHLRLDLSANDGDATILCAHTLDEESGELRGITIKKNGYADSDLLSIYVDDKDVSLSVSGETAIMITWTKIGNVSYIVYSLGDTHGCYCYVHESHFNNKIYLGASEKEDGTIWRYSVGDIDYIRIKKI